MTQLETSAIISTLANTGVTRISNRVARRMRYRWVYPWAARYLFPVDAVEG